MAELINLLKGVFDYILLGWDQLLKIVGGIVPWINSNFALKDFLDSIIKALGVIQLPF